MKELNELVELANLPYIATDGRSKADMLPVHPETILAIAEAFRALEQENTLLKQGCENDALRHEMLDWKERAEEGEAKLAVLEKHAEKGWKWAANLADDRTEQEERAEAAEAKFKNILAAEHSLSAAYVRLREILGTIDLPPGSDIWEETEKAASILVERAEAAESWVKIAERTMDHQANIITELGIRAEAAEEKLAELEKQEPVGYTYNRGINCEIVVADLNYDCPCGVDLFARPAPAVSLAELVPEDTKRMDWLVSMCVEVREPLRYGSAPVFHAVAVTDEEDDYHATTLREQIDAILRNIEEAK